MCALGKDRHKRETLVETVFVANTFVWESCYHVELGCEKSLLSVWSVALSLLENWPSVLYCVIMTDYPGYERLAVITGRVSGAVLVLRRGLVWCEFMR